MYTLIDDVAPPGTTTEAFTWTFTANWMGAAAGSAVAGAAVQGSGIRSALMIAVGGAALGAAITTVRRRTLRSRPRVSAIAMTATGDVP